MGRASCIQWLIDQRAWRADVEYARWIKKGWVSQAKWENEESVLAELLELCQNYGNLSGVEWPQVVPKKLGIAGCSDYFWIVLPFS